MATLTTSYQKIKEVYLGNTGYSNIYLRNYAKYNSQDITNNRTNVSVQLRIYTESAWWMQQSGGYWAIGLTDNTTISGQANQRFEIGETTLGTLTGWVNHNSDGTKNCACLGSVNFIEWGWSGTVDIEATLPTIPRTSKLNSATMTIATNGASITVTPNITKYSSSFYDSLIIKDGNITVATLDGVTHNTAKSLSSTQISSVYNAIGIATSKKFTCYIATYTNSSKTSLVGNSSSVNLTATLPSYSITATITASDTITAYNTYKPNNNTYIANVSKPQFIFGASSSTGSYYGRSVTFKLNNTVRTSPYTENNYTGQSFTLVASDGRKSNTKTPTMTHIPYFKPTLNVNVTRSTPTGSTINVSISGSYYDGNGLTNLRTAKAVLKYTEQGGSEQTVNLTLSTTTSNHKVNFTASTQLTGMNYQKKVTWNVVLTDRINITATKGNVLPQGLPVWNGYRKNDKNYFNINGNFLIDNVLLGNLTSTYKRLPISEISSNLNNLDTYGSGIFSLTDAGATKQLTNSPYGNGTEYQHWYILQFSYNQVSNTDYITQIAVHVYLDNGIIYMRKKVSGTWKNWKSITMS